MGMSDLPALKIKISPTAKSGEKLIVRGVVELPGDIYRSTRQEPFELTQTLAVNPAHDFSLVYDHAPDIKNVFRRKVHSMKVKLSPKLEDIKDGYKVSIHPVGEAASMMEMQIASVSTGELAAGSSKDLEFSYVFKDEAKGKTITLMIEVFHRDRMIRKEVVALKPK
jgi:hypothetical protein